MIVAALCLLQTDLFDLRTAKEMITEIVRHGYIEHKVAALSLLHNGCGNHVMQMYQ